MDVLVINLDRSPERLQHMRAALGKLDLPFERIAAVDGDLLPESELRSFAAERPFFPWTPGVVGCLLSHAEAWRIASTSPEGWTVVLEDDVLISPALPDFLRLLEGLASDINLCRFESCRYGPVWLGAQIAVLGDAAVFRLGSKVGGSAAYAIRGRGAAGLLGNWTKISRPADEIFTPHHAQELGLMVGQTVPAFAEQSFDETSVLIPERRARRLAEPKLSRWARARRSVMRRLSKSVRAIYLTLRGYRRVSLWVSQ